MSRKLLMMEPEGYPCTIADCPPGFFLSGDELCLKTEYSNRDKQTEAYCGSGEYFCAKDSKIVQPVIYIWKEEE